MRAFFCSKIYLNEACFPRKTEIAFSRKTCYNNDRFAWNEFEEGGFICPTYNEDLSVNTDRVHAVREIIKYWKETL